MAQIWNLRHWSNPRSNLEKERDEATRTLKNLKTRPRIQRAERHPRRPWVLENLFLVKKGESGQDYPVQPKHRFSAARHRVFGLTAQDHSDLAQPGSDLVLQKGQVHDVQPHSQPIQSKADREHLSQTRSLWETVQSECGLPTVDGLREHSR